MLTQLLVVTLITCVLGAELSHDGSQRSTRAADLDASGQVSSEEIFTLSRSVSIKTPVRKSTTISHFTPAVNRFDTTGSVTINRSGESSEEKVVKTTRRVSRPVTKVVRKPAALDLSRTVTIKTPERNNGVIAFFTPAVNRFDTTGSVTINRSGESSEEKVVKTTRRVSRPVTKAVSKPLTRTVTINTPERPSGVISHFTPAVHSYKAQGKVTINRN